MHYAMEQALSHAQTAVIIGTDCPVMDANYLKAAFHALDNGNDVVLGPAEDGGYVLFGARRLDSSLFRSIRWGSDSVLSNTRSALQELGWAWSELDTLWDIDRPEDLDRIRSDQRLSELFAQLSP